MPSARPQLHMGWLDLHPNTSMSSIAGSRMALKHGCAMSNLSFRT